MHTHFRPMAAWVNTTRILVLVSMTIAAVTVLAAAADGYDDHGRKRGHYRKHGGSKNYLGISPQGITYGVYGKHFGIEIGPMFGPGGWHDSGPAAYVPQYEEGFLEPPALETPNYLSTPYQSSFPNNQYRAANVAPPAEPQPELSQTNQEMTVVSTNPPAAIFQVQAENAFRQQRYDDALRLARHASIEDAQNGWLSLFRSQAAFATGQYDVAYQQLNSAISILERDQWGTVVKRYDELYTGDDYVKQMDQLIQFASANPESGYLETLRGYHYAYLGHAAAARKHLIKALEIDSSDLAAQKILSTLGEPLPPPRPMPKPMPLDQQSSDDAKLSGPR